MNFPVTRDDETARKRKILQYRQVLDSQVRQKHAKSIQNRNSMGDFESPSRIDRNPEHSFNFQRRMLERSKFLPCIQDTRRHQRAYTYANADDDEYNRHDGDDTMDCLRDCELIIQNLRVLTRSSTKSIPKKKKVDKISISQSFIHNQKSEHRNDGVSFFRSNGDEIVKARNSKPVAKKTIDKTPKLDDSDVKVHSRQSSDSIKDLKFAEKDKEEEDQFKTIQNNADKKQNKDSSEMKRIQFCKTQREQNTNQENSLEKNKSLVNKIDDNAENVKTKDEQKDLSPIERRQKFFLKYLNKANNRGHELQRKIMEHKIKKKESIITPIRTKAIESDQNKEIICIQNVSKNKKNKIQSTQIQIKILPFQKQKKLITNQIVVEKQQQQKQKQPSALKYKQKTKNNLITPESKVNIDIQQSIDSEKAHQNFKQSQNQSEVQQSLSPQILLFNCIIPEIQQKQNCLGESILVNQSLNYSKNNTQIPQNK